MSSLTQSEVERIKNSFKNLFNKYTEEFNALFDTYFKEDKEFTTLVNDKVKKELDCLSKDENGNKAIII